MSIAGIGSHGSGTLTQMLSSLLSRLDTTSTTSKTTDSAVASQSKRSVSADTSLTGSTKPSLSSMILGALIGLQGQNASEQRLNTSEGSTDSTDAVSNLFSAMDSDSDGSVTQSELETYLAQYGGTTEQADTLYSLLNTSDSDDGISQDEMASQAPPPPPPGPPPGDRGGPSQTSDDTSSNGGVSEKLTSLFDTNGDGTVTESEYQAFITAHGGTEANATEQYAALDSDSSGTITSSDFADALDKLQKNDTSDPYAAIVTMMDVLAKNISTGSSVSISA